MIPIANGILLNLDWIYSWAQAQPSDRRYVGSLAAVARGIIPKQNFELVHFKPQYHRLQGKIQTFHTNPPVAYISLNLSPTFSSLHICIIFLETLSHLSLRLTHVYFPEHVLNPKMASLTPVAGPESALFWVPTACMPLFDTGIEEDGQLSPT